MTAHEARGLLMATPAIVAEIAVAAAGIALLQESVGLFVAAVFAKTLEPLQVGHAPAAAPVTAWASVAEDDVAAATAAGAVAALAAREVLAVTSSAAPAAPVVLAEVVAGSLPVTAAVPEAQATSLVACLFGALPEGFVADLAQGMLASAAAVAVASGCTSEVLEHTRPVPAGATGAAPAACSWVTCLAVAPAWETWISPVANPSMGP